MKDLKVLALVLVASLALAGCEEKNQEYYSKHIDSAKEKLNECDKTLYKAMKENDEKLFTTNNTRPRMSSGG